MQTYSSKSTALRGAKRAGIENPEVAQNEEGKWYVVAPATDAERAEQEETVNYAINDGTNSKGEPAAPATPVVAPEGSGMIVPKRVGGGKSYKELARIAPAKSAVGTPVEFVKQFLALNPTMSRKEAVAALVGNGINIHTARTQIQKFRAANKQA